MTVSKFSNRIKLQESRNAMQEFKTLSKSRLVVLIGGIVLALSVAWPLMGTAQDKSVKANAPDPHAQHKDKQPAGNQDMASQIAELGKKVARLEAALEKSQASGMTGMGAKKPPRGMGGKKPAMGMMEDDMDEMGSMQPAGGMAGMGGAGGGEMGMKMDKMMGMMEKMMGGGSMQPASAGAGMAGTGGGELEMKMDKMLRMMEKITSGGSMQPAQGAPAMGAMPHM